MINKHERLRLLTLLSLLFFIGVMSASGQERLITIKVKNVSLSEVFNVVEKQTNYRFSYRDVIIDSEKNITVSEVNVSVPYILDLVLKDRNLKYDIVSPKSIVISDKHPGTPNKQSSRNITGIVKDIYGEPVIGANILIKGTTNGVISDIDGKFSFNDIQLNSVLEVSYIGFDIQEVKLKDGAPLIIILEENSTLLEELVVIGYGTVRKRDLTGAVSQINADQIQKGPVTNILQSVQGRIPGFQTTPSSGQPGADNNVLIHGTQSINGTNSPIYVIDGTISENISNINPQDIETFTVLKDASAVAIYGSRAANGVVVINTKRGKSDEKPTISFKTEQSFQQEGNLKINYLNAAQWLDIATEAYRNGGKDIPWGDSDLEKVKGNDNCWPDLMKRTGYLTNNNLSITGGSKNSNYFVSLNYLYNEGIIKDQSYNRLNLRLNSDHKIGTRIKFGHSVNLYASEQTSQRDFDYRDTYAASFRYSPLNGMYGSDGDFATISNTYLQSKTPSPLWMLSNSDRTTRNKGIDGNLYLAIDILEGLKFTARVSGEWKNRYSNDFIGAMETKYGMEGSNVNKVTKTNAETFHWITDYILDYQKTFNQIHSYQQC